MIRSQFPIRANSNLVKPTVYVGVIISLSLLPLLIRSPYLIHIFILVFIYIIATVSLRAICISGQFPLAHSAFMGIGAYTSAVVANELGWPPWLTIPMGGFLAMGIGSLIGYPFARLRALYYGMVSLFFGIGVLQVIAMFPEWTNSYIGLSGIPPLLPAATSKVPYFYFFLGLTSLCLLVLYRFEHCRIGTSLKAIAQSYLVAGSVGINEARYRVIALAVGCFFVGIAGATYAHYNRTISISGFDLQATLWLFIYALVGGMGNFAGPVVGTAFLIMVPEFFRELKAFVPFLSAGILLIVVFVLPRGLVSLPEAIWLHFRERRKDKGVPSDT